MVAVFPLACVGEPGSEFGTHALAVQDRAGSLGNGCRFDRDCDAEQTCLTEDGNGQCACQTYYKGELDAHLMLDIGTIQVVNVSGPFPSMRFGGRINGMGHYHGGPLEGLAGGYLFPVWAEPVATTDPNVGDECPPCEAFLPNKRYSLWVQGARVIP